MPHLVISAAALADLKRLRGFLHTKNPRAAKEAALTIIEAVQSLQLYPEMGRTIETKGEELRELFINSGNYGYLAKYKFDEREVVILAIKHGREASY